MPRVRPHIVIVEDDSDIADMISMFLAAEGYGIRVVDNHTDALLALKSLPHRFLLLDYNIPAPMPQAFVSRVAQEHPEMTIVLMTAATSIKTRATEIGVQHWIGKPFDPEILLQLIQEIEAKHPD
jgi:DNA-binding NtrC family response regulator